MENEVLLGLLQESWMALAAFIASSLLFQKENTSKYSGYKHNGIPLLELLTLAFAL